MKGQKIAKILRRAAANLPREMERAERANLTTALASARRWSGGRLSRVQRRRHPYARRHGVPLADPGRINVVSRVFQGSWRKWGPLPTGDGTDAAIFNSDPKGPLLEGGTRFMFARPLLDRVVAEIWPTVEYRRNEAIGRSFR
jgi:hypothetical protein